MKKITEGNYGNQVYIKKDNELKELANGFNLMSEALKIEKEEKD